MLSGVRIGVVVPAAGSGSRMAGPRAKQFLELGGVPVLLRTVMAFERSLIVDAIVVAVRPRDLAEVKAILRPCRKVAAVVRGGAHRQESVWNGLKRLGKTGAGIVLIHDAVRPFVSAKLIRDVARAALRHGSAIAAVPAKDTLKRSRRGMFVDETLWREEVWNAQTPQGFRTTVIMDAFRRARKEGLIATDDAALAEHAGMKVKIVEGSYQNIKITTPEDMDLARRIAARGRRADWRILGV